MEKNCQNVKTNEDNVVELKATKFGTKVPPLYTSDNEIEDFLKLPMDKFLSWHRKDATHLMFYIQRYKDPDDYYEAPKRGDSIKPIQTINEGTTKKELYEHIKEIFIYIVNYYGLQYSDNIANPHFKATIVVIANIIRALLDMVTKEMDRRFTYIYNGAVLYSKDCLNPQSDIPPNQNLVEYLSLPSDYYKNLSY